MPGESKGRFLLVYGSQTGQAEAIAEEMCETAISYGLEPELYCLSKTDKKFNIEREKCMVMVVSTTGEGDPPDSALKFWRRIKKKTLPTDYLSHMKYALLGLGDSNYTNFCNCSKMFDEKLQDLGAEHFYPTGYGDDAVGLEVAVEPWMDGLWPVLQKELGVTDVKFNSVTTLYIPEPTLDRTSDKPEINGSNDRSKDSEEINGTSSQKTIDKDSLPVNGISDLKITEPNSHIESDGKTNGDIDITDSSRNARNQDSQTHNKTTSVIKSISDTACTESSLTSSLPPLADMSLSLPVVSPPFIEIKYSDEKWDSSHCPIQNDAKLPSAASSVSMATVTKATILTGVDAIKKTLELELETPDYQYSPGDSISIVCENDPNEVEQLFRRLNVCDVAEDKCILSVMADTKKRRAMIHDYIPTEATLRHIFTTCCDIRTTLKKACFRMLVDYTTDPDEKRRLQELTSKQGSDDYAKFVREAHVSLLDILLNFPSCHPPVERLIEHLPRLQPRPYSVCSSPLEIPSRIRVAFNLVEIEAGSGRHGDRQGVCTGWLNRITEKIQTSIAEEVNTDNSVQVPVYFRTNQHFHLPEDPSVDVIMIGPGTGVAPFVGMIKHRHAMKAAGTKIGKLWLFYGCRNEAQDYLYRNDLERLHTCGTLSKLSVCFSRDLQSAVDKPRYVQDNLRLHGKLLFEWLQSGAHIYVCGDANHMAKDVNEAWADIFCEHEGVMLDVAKAKLMSMRLNHKYLEDVWS